MKILFSISTYSFKTYHSFAKELKKKYPETKFAFQGSNKRGAISYLKKQNDIEYSFYHLEIEDYNNEKIDYNLIYKIEEFLPHKSICKL